MNSIVIFDEVERCYNDYDKADMLVRSVIDIAKECHMSIEEVAKEMVNNMSIDKAVYVLDILWAKDYPLSSPEFMASFHLKFEATNKKIAYGRNQMSKFNSAFDKVNRLWRLV